MGSKKVVTVFPRFPSFPLFSQIVGCDEPDGSRNTGGALTILEPTGSGLKHQRAFGRGFPKGEGSAGLQRVSRCKQKSVSVLPCMSGLWQTARSPRGQPSELPAPFEEIFAGNGAGSAGLLKETLAALRAALNFSKSAFPMQNADIFPRLLFSFSRRNTLRGALGGSRTGAEPLTIINYPWDKPWNA